MSTTSALMLSEFNHIPFFMVIEDNWSIAEEMLYINNEFGDNDFNIDINIVDNTNDEFEDQDQDQYQDTTLDLISSVYGYWEKVLSELNVLLLRRSRRDSMRLIPRLSCNTKSV